MFVRVVPKPVIDEILFSIFLRIILRLASKRISLFNYLVPVFFNSFLNECLIEFANDVISLIGCIDQPNRNPLDCTILDNDVFENIKL